MSYQEQAQKINNIFRSLPFTNYQGDCVDLINTILWFGQVAKYRCRSNTAYDNFARLCFEGIVELERKPLEGQEFDILQVVQQNEAKPK